MWTFWTITWWIRVCYHVCVSVGLLTWKCLWFLRDTPEGVECFCPALLLWLVVRVNNVEWLEEIPLCRFKAFTQSHHTYRAHIQVSRNACSYTTQYHISGTPMQTLTEKYQFNVIIYHKNISYQITDVKMYWNDKISLSI